MLVLDWSFIVANKRQTQLAYVAARVSSEVLFLYAYCSSIHFWKERRGIQCTLGVSYHPIFVPKCQNPLLEAVALRMTVQFLWRSVLWFREAEGGWLKVFIHSTVGKICNSISCSMESPSINYSFPILPGLIAAEEWRNSTETCQKEGQQPWGHLLCCKMWTEVFGFIYQKIFSFFCLPGKYSSFWVNSGAFFHPRWFFSSG